MDTLSISQSSITVSSIFLNVKSHKLKQNLLHYIDKIPGIRYRQLLRLTNSSNGTLSYHLAQLEQSKRIMASRKKGVTRYYPAHISAEISKIIGCIRNPASRQIIAILLKNNGSTLSELTTLTEKAPSTVSWHLHRLVNAGVVIKNSVSDSKVTIYGSKFYHVSDKPMVEEVMSKYVETSIDRLINDYSELIDELR